jgi:hypothetical protein
MNWARDHMPKEGKPPPSGVEGAVLSSSRHVHIREIPPDAGRDPLDPPYISTMATTPFSDIEVKWPGFG